jgi:hypothetical protein
MDDARLAQGDAFLDERHSKPGCTGGFKLPRAFDSPMAVGVSLDNGHDFDRVAYLAFY